MSQKAPVGIKALQLAAGRLQRNLMKQMLDDIERRMPGRMDRMIRALATVRPSHLLDRSLFDFVGLQQAR